MCQLFYLLRGIRFQSSSFIHPGRPTFSYSHWNQVIHYVMHNHRDKMSKTDPFRIGYDIHIGDMVIGGASDAASAPDSTIQIALY